MPLFRVAGNEIVEYEEEIEADSAEQAEVIFIKNINIDMFDKYSPRDAHSWQWHETKEITDE
jgi:hypothetical protein